MKKLKIEDLSITSFVTKTKPKNHLGGLVPMISIKPEDCTMKDCFSEFCTNGNPGC